mmetsp:Transcript_3873/g.4382  ORF Transcript_3873/g.4382 Transcript_3873/m.4382 type:complete len:111 (-) Transcript_3873:381-713(-)
MIFIPFNKGSILQIEKFESMMDIVLLSKTPKTFSFSPLQVPVQVLSSFHRRKMNPLVFRQQLVQISFSFQMDSSSSFYQKDQNHQPSHRVSACTEVILDPLLSLDQQEKD